jgi:hypothetical protein
MFKNPRLLRLCVVGYDQFLLAVLRVTKMEVLPWCEATTRKPQNITNILRFAHRLLAAPHTTSLRQ